MFSDYAIYIRDKDGHFRDRLNNISSMDIIEKLNDPGNWVINSRTPERCPFTAGDGIVVYKNGVYYYSGIVTKITEEYDGYDGQYSWTIEGVGDIDFLNRRICYVDPETGSTTETAYYTDTGTIYEVVKRLIDKNIGISAMPERQEPIIGEMPVIPMLNTISVKLRFPNLLQTIVSILDTDSYSLNTEWDADNRKLIYSIRGSNNLSEFMLFSTELNSVISINYLAKAPEGNFIMSAGQGELTDRAFAYAQDNESISEWGRIEYYRDVRSTEVGNLQNDADTTLKKGSGENVGYSAELNTDAAFLQYRRDWNIGDYVGIVVHGVTMIRRVMQVKTSLTYERETVTPTIGTLERGQLAKIFDKISRLRSDVDHLEWSNS